MAVYKPRDRMAREDLRLANLLGAVALGVTDAAVADVAAQADLDSTSAAALVAMLDLARSGSVQRLSQLVGISHSGAVRLVNRLADAGLVERRAGPDGRTITVALTRRGHNAARRLRDARHAAIFAVLSSLSDRQRRELTGICEQLVARLTASRLAARVEGRSPAGGALCRVCDPVACGRPEGVCPAARTAAG